MNIVSQQYPSNKTSEGYLIVLMREGYISDYSIEEKWYNPIVHEGLIRARWQELIDEDVDYIAGDPLRAQTLEARRYGRG